MQRALVVDDHLEARARVRSALQDVYEPEEICEASTAQAASRQVDGGPFDFAVIDLSLPDGRGESLIGKLRAANPDCYVVVWTIHDQTARLIDVLAQGANGYLLKDQDEASLRNSFKRIQFGEPPLSASVTRRLLEYVQQQGGPEHRSPAGTGKISGNLIDDPESLLTDREREILVLLSQGFNRPDVAGILGISKSTVATHTANIYAKLNVNSRLEAMERARQFGFI
ncbi:response regulator [Marimonas lutisalis]|uniref:response regulator n=1 Tax=Marimonas lutisalis TaxID=2545756 RepID=UPI0010F5B92A|nr:response regulator transcription factor [Marimonas lutisalis]